MADKKITQLDPATTPLDGTEVLPIVQSGVTKKVSVDNLTAGKTVKATTFDTDVTAAKITLAGTTLTAAGTDTNIDINLTPKGTGEVNITKVDIDAGSIDGTTIGANAAAAGTFTTATANNNLVCGANTFGSTGSIEKNNVGTEVSFTIYNTDNTNGASVSLLRIFSGGASGGDPLINFEVVGVATRRYIGMDNSNDDLLTIGRGYSPGAADDLSIDANGNVIINSAAIATNATNGFLYVPTCAGTPSGTPTTHSGRAPIVVDTTNNKLYFYSSGQWRDAGP